MDELDTRWVTYAELAEARGIDKASAIRLVQRHHWPRQKGNDGATVRVLVPATFLQLSGDLSGDPALDTNGVSHDVSGDMSHGEARFIKVLKDQLERERQRADRAEEALAQMKRDWDMITARTEAALTLADQRATELRGIEAKLGKAEGLAEGLKVALDEARRPSWRRWLGL
jgi:hypothetical protein